MATSDLGALGIGDLSGLALFALALGILLWPMTRRIVEARRQRAAELRLAGDERK